MFAWFGRIVASIFSFKFFMSGVFMTIGGIILYNLMVEIVEEVFNFALSKAGAVSVEGITSPTITGFSAWFLAQLKVPEILSVIIACTIIRFSLRKIPFLNW